MAKIILTENRTPIRELSLTKARITIGRRTHNDIVLHDIAVSGEHAAILTTNGDSILEDLNSTNGTQVNGQPIKKHFLQDNDVIELAHYRLIYVLDASADAIRDARSGAASTPASGKGKWIAPYRPQAKVQLLDGANAGKEVLLEKALTTIGQPGGQVAVIFRAANGYSLSPVDGSQTIVVNGAVVSGAVERLADGDVIELGGARMRFCSFG